MRGADVRTIPSMQSLLGSSPLARGRLTADGEEVGLVRHIPACAGQITRRKALTWLSEAYPRMCGAKEREP